MNIARNMAIQLCKESNDILIAMQSTLNVDSAAALVVTIVKIVSIIVVFDTGEY